MSATVRRLGLIQRAGLPDIEANMEGTLAAISDAAEQGAQIICTQELFQSRYFCQTEDASHFDLAEPIPGPTTQRLQETAARREVVIVASLFEERAPGLFHNTAVVVDADGKLLGRYRKMHIPDDPGFCEKYYFTPGDLGFRVFPTRFGRIGVLICWDQWFPEAARLTAMQGADLLVYPTAIGWLPSEKAALGEEQFESWQTIQRSHAIANGCFVASINRVGMEPCEGLEGIEFWGGSFVASPSGRMIAEASRTDAAVLLADVDWAQIRETRVQWPFFRDRRIDAYGSLSQRYGTKTE